MPQGLWQYRIIYSSEMVARVREGKYLGENCREEANIGMGVPWLLTTLFGFMLCSVQRAALCVKEEEDNMEVDKPNHME